jgi:hypothetical protein
MSIPPAYRMSGPGPGRWLTMEQWYYLKSRRDDTTVQSLLRAMDDCQNEQAFIALLVDAVLHLSGSCELSRKVVAEVLATRSGVRPVPFSVTEAEPEPPPPPAAA